jgi:DNA adenine methylase Dam
MKISPIFYMGNKKKLIKKGLIELFPKDIDTMVELFGGSSIVSINSNANKYIVSDIDNNLVSLYKLFKYKDSDTIINHINSRIDEYGLARERTKRNEFKDKEKIELYKQAYMNFRGHYNKDKNVLDFYTLMFYSFSQQFRFNNKGDFNMPCGNDCFSKLNEEYIKNGCDFFGRDNVCIGQADFRGLNIDNLGDNDFVYLDPPYLNTTATYNENNGWNEKDEDDLYNLCEELHSKGIKFGLSNVFENKGIKNDKLINWCEKNNWNVYTFDKFTYMACGKGNSNAKEVFITNY